ncbi:MAG: cell division protein FtsQ, partial [Lysobacterales bacterium CG_4_9_14_3_um_filter_62_6]
RSNGLQPFATELSARGAWTLSLTQGASVVLGNRDVDQRLHRFSKVFRE